MSSHNSPSLDFKSATLYAVRLVLHSAETSVLLEELRQRLKEAGDFFDGEPVVIDATGLTSAPDWKALARILGAANMPLIGAAAPDPLHSGLRKAGFAIVSLPTAREAAGSTGNAHRDASGNESTSNQAVAPGAQAVPDMSAPAVARSVPAVKTELLAEAGVANKAEPNGEPPGDEVVRPTLLLDRSVRSGQSVYARGADLIIVGTVSAGAEVIADGHIHVYGALRGKAMAGARGDEAARIFTTHLDAELVAVAGVYRVVDTKLPDEVLQRPAAVRLHDGGLSIEPLVV
nr:septum site-determining protein MinC [Pseudomonas sp.]